MDERMPINIGHGHVYARPDGVKARCGGPYMCPQCALDQARKEAKKPRTAQEISDAGWEYARTYAERYARRIPYDSLDIASAYMDGIEAALSISAGDGNGTG